MKKVIITILAIAATIGAEAQTLADTTKTKDIQQVNVVSRRKANYVSRSQVVKAEVTTESGLAKMACCTLAESFENSAAVTVGYSDAISGARQIKMLGLSGIYTQMLDESRPVMRGLSSPYGLSYTPGAWLKSIQTSKGVSSVIAGHEAITGQINVEPRKPTDTERLFVNAYFDQDMRAELNVTSAIPVVADRLSTVLMAHGSQDFQRIDHNGDGFMDLPMTAQMNFANRWLYTAANGMQVRAGAKFVRESRKGGQMDYDFSTQNTDYWGSKIENTLLNGYLKVAMPTDEKGSNIAFVADYTTYKNDYYYGLKKYVGREISVLGNLFYSWKISEMHSLVAGISATSDCVIEHIGRSENYGQHENIAGAFAEYTINLGEKVTAIAGMRADYSNQNDLFYTPRAHLKWSITEGLVLRGSAGLGYRSSQLISDNLWVLPLGRGLGVAKDIDRLEKALTFGGSLTQSFRLGYDKDAYVSLDVFRTSLQNTVYADQEITPNGQVHLYNTKGETTTYQIDFSWNAFERFDVLATFRYNDSYVYNRDGIFIEKPLVDRFKGLLNLQYATKFRRWVFDVTGQINGQSRLPQVNGVTGKYSPVYPIFYAQVTRKFKGIELYLGCENIADYRQLKTIIAANQPFGIDFNPSVVWGPLMGRKVYFGMRFTLDTY